MVDRNLLREFDISDEELVETQHARILRDALGYDVQRRLALLKRFEFRVHVV